MYISQEQPADYVPASQYGVKAPFEVEDENFMIVCFSGSKANLNGMIEYDKAFISTKGEKPSNRNLER